VPEGETPQIKVTIFTSRTSVLEPGETITLTSLVENAEGYNVAYQWECNKGSGFTAVPGATADTYTFEADVTHCPMTGVLASPARRNNSVERSSAPN
jgi:hypothetical protein